MPADLDRAARLRKARQAAGYDRPVDAARAFGWNESTYFGHENGSRGMSRGRVIRYAKAFRTTVAWLNHGHGSMRGQQTIRIEGIVNEHGTIEISGGMADEVDQIELPEGINPDEFVAYRVGPLGFLPLLQQGDVVLVPRRHGPPEDYIGHRCIITLPDGSKHLRVLSPGSRKDRYTLFSPSRPLIIDTELVAAAPIAWIKPALT